MLERIAHKSLAGSVLLKTAAYALKLSIGFALVYWLHRQGFLDPEVLFAIEIDLRFLVTTCTACVLVVGAVILLAIRLRIVLQLQSIGFPFGKSLGLTMIGSLFGAVLPGVVAGDVVRAVYMVRGNKTWKSKAVAAVIVDRMVGFYGLFVLGSGASLVAWTEGRFDVKMYPMLIVAPVLTLAGTIALAVFMMLDYGGGTLAHRVITKLPRICHNLIFVLADYAKNGTRLTQAIGISIVSHALIVLSYFAIGILVRDSLTVGQHFVLDPLAMVLNAVPLTPGGLGITESAFAHLFHSAGSANGALIGLLGRATQYVVFSIGGVMAIITMRGSR